MNGHVKGASAWTSYSVKPSNSAANSERVGAEPTPAICASANSKPRFSRWPKLPARLRKRPTKPVCAWTRNFPGWLRPSPAARPADAGPTALAVIRLHRSRHSSAAASQGELVGQTPLLRSSMDALWAPKSKSNSAQLFSRLGKPVGATAARCRLESRISTMLNRTECLL